MLIFWLYIYYIMSIYLRNEVRLWFGGSPTYVVRRCLSCRHMSPGRRFLFENCALEWSFRVSLHFQNYNRSGTSCPSFLWYSQKVSLRQRPSIQALSRPLLMNREETLSASRHIRFVCIVCRFESGKHNKIRTSWVRILSFAFWYR